MIWKTCEAPESPRRSSRPVRELVPLPEAPKTQVRVKLISAGEWMRTRARRSTKECMSRAWSREHCSLERSSDRFSWALASILRYDKDKFRSYIDEVKKHIFNGRRSHDDI